MCQSADILWIFELAWDCREGVDRVEGKSISFKNKWQLLMIPKLQMGFVQRIKQLTCTEKYCLITFTFTFSARLISNKNYRKNKTIAKKKKHCWSEKTTPNQQCWLRATFTRAWNCVADARGPFEDAPFAITRTFIPTLPRRLLRNRNGTTKYSAILRQWSLLALDCLTQWCTQFEVGRDETNLIS